MGSATESRPGRARAPELPAPEVREVQAVPEVQAVLEVRGVREVPEARGVREVPEARAVPEVPGGPEVRVGRGMTIRAPLAYLALREFREPLGQERARSRSSAPFGAGSAVQAGWVVPSLDASE